MEIIPSKIDILGFAQNPNAAEKMVKEVERIGLKSEVFWNIRSAWDRLCINNITHKTKYMSKDSAFSCLRGHYHIIQKAIDMGMPSIWVCEDDTRFRKDPAIVFETLSKAPSDADMLLLDYNVAGEINDGTFENYRISRNKMENAVNGWWEVDTEDLRGAGDYIMSLEAMVKYAELLSMGAGGEVMIAADMGRNHYYFPRLKIYAASPNLSIQRIDNKYRHMCCAATLEDNWRRCNINPNNYQEW